MILFHTALYCEAKPLIKYFNLIQYNKFIGYKIYKNENIVLIVSGVGKINTVEKLDFVFKKFNINKAVNIGICGCKDDDIELGKLYSIINKYENISKETITTLDNPCDNSKLLDTLLVDMEFKYFLEICKKYLPLEKIESFKIVSDHLDSKFPSKKFVEEIIDKSIKIWYNTLL